MSLPIYSKSFDNFMIKTRSAFTAAAETLPPGSRKVVHPQGPWGESIHPGVLPGLESPSSVTSQVRRGAGTGTALPAGLAPFPEAVWKGWSQQEAQTGESGAAQC